MHLNSTLSTLPMAQPVGARPLGAKPAVQAQPQQAFGAVAEMLHEGVAITGQLAQDVQVVTTQKGESLLVNLGKGLRAILIPGGELTTPKGTVKFAPPAEVIPQRPEARYQQGTIVDLFVNSIGVIQNTGQGSRVASTLQVKPESPVVKATLQNGDTVHASFLETSIDSMARAGVKDFIIDTLVGQKQQLERMLEVSPLLPRPINIKINEQAKGTGDLGEGGLASLQEAANAGKGVAVAFTDAIYKGFDQFAQSANELLSRNKHLPTLVDLNEPVSGAEMGNYGQSLTTKGMGGVPVKEKLKTGLSAFPVISTMEQPKGERLAFLQRLNLAGKHTPLSWTGASFMNPEYVEMAARNYKPVAQGGFTKAGEELGWRKSSGGNATINEARRAGGGAFAVADMRPQPQLHFLDGGSSPYDYLNTASVKATDAKTGVTYVPLADKPDGVMIGGEPNRVIITDSRNVQKGLDFFTSVGQLVGIK